DHVLSSARSAAPPRSTAKRWGSKPNTPSVSSSLLLKGYDEPEILRSQLSQFGPISADAGHPAGRRLWRLSRAGRQERRNARLLLGACAPALLRTRRSRSSADRQR